MADEETNTEGENNKDSEDPTVNYTGPFKSYK